ncbi:MAG: YkgJ family cysteine cluster protein [Acidobacteriia bacterium]|nr:YkgJ family cysteine cluster protein [Terriglobia bacterium]
MTDAAHPPRRSTARNPWYAEGLRFACLPDCGKCCTRHGEYDFVYLDPDDVVRLAAHLHLDGESFLEKHAAEDDGYVILRMDGPSCPFLRGTACSVYEARPTQCRTFPFWRENVRSRTAWERLRDFCPGIGEGDLHGVATIRSVTARKPEP